MNEIKLEHTGLFPTYLNLASSNTKFQQVDENVTARLVDFSSCNTTYLVKQDAVPVQQYVVYAQQQM